MTLSPSLAGQEFLGFLSNLYQRENLPCYPGESLSLAEHMLQCAHLAVQQSESDNIIAAALLHDIGHLLPTVECDSLSIDHEITGAEFLGEYFPPAVTECVRLHVATKRYLCTTDPEYFNSLSTACKGTLKSQGGLMTITEAQQFQQHPHLSDLLKVRRLDDQAIAADVHCAQFDHYRGMLLKIMDDQ